MPTYSVQINVNVPGLGDRNVVQANVVAPNIEAAIVLAKTSVTVTTLAAQQTAP